MLRRWGAARGQPALIQSSKLRRRFGVARKKAQANGGKTPKVEEFRHKRAKRKNNPPAKIAAEGMVPVLPRSQYSYSPRRPPVLRFDDSGNPDALPEVARERRSMVQRSSRADSPTLWAQAKGIEAS